MKATPMTAERREAVKVARARQRAATFQKNRAEREQRRRRYAAACYFSPMRVRAPAENA